MNPVKQEAGRLGGLQTFLRYGPEHMSNLGKTGGRPRTPDLSQCQQLQTLNNNKKGGKLPQGNSLKALKELWQLRLQSRGESKMALPD